MWWAKETGRPTGKATEERGEIQPAYERQRRRPRERKTSAYYREKEKRQCSVVTHKSTEDEKKVERETRGGTPTQKGGRGE